MHRFIKYSFFLILFILTVSCNSGREREEQSVFFPVTRVVDGDTFWVDDGSEKGLKIRLIGVNTPEINHPYKGAEYYGKEASDYTKSLLTGKKVKLVYDIDRFDKYGRTLAYVYLKNGTFLNADLLINGYAKVLTVAPNVKYAEEFKQLERKARKEKVGLWQE